MRGVLHKKLKRGLISIIFLKKDLLFYVFDDTVPKNKEVLSDVQR